MTENDASGVLWRRLRYMLTPQADLYQSIGVHISDYMANGTVLEVGFGTGAGTLQLADSGNHVIAIEIDKYAVEFANKTFPITGVRWLKENILVGGIHTEFRYGAVVMVEVLEHIQDWEKALQAAKELMNPDAFFYMTFRNANADLRRNELHERELTAEQLHANLSRFFRNVQLFDYTLDKPKELDTRITPLIAIAQK